MSIKNKISAIVIAASLIVSSISPTFNALAETITGTYEYTSNEDTMLQNKDGFEFSDECFTRSSFLGCQHLEILSAQASLASDCRFGDAYSDYSHYPDNINSFLKKCGFSDVSDNKYYTLMSQKNSAAAAVGHMTVRQDGKDYTLLAIIPRSARYKQEWAGNFDVGDGEIHEGFKAGRDEILRYVKQYIQQNDISGDLKVWVAGHSRGAALSNQLGAFFAGGGIGYFGDNVSITPEDVYCYTFGTPRTIKNGADKNSELSVSGNRSDSAYAGDTPGAAYSYTKGGTVDIHDAAYGGIRNFVTGDDIFTYLPLELWGFEHYGTDISRDHNVVSADKMLAELSGISKYASDLYAAGKGADSFERKTFDLKTLSLVTDSKKHSAMDLQSFLAEMINGLSQNARTNKAYVENDCQAALTAAAGLYGAVSDLDILDLPDEDINYLGTLLTTYLAYASERLQAEGRAENDAEAALITICEALEYLTGEKLDARTATVDDLLLYFAKYREFALAEYSSGK